MRGHVFLVLLMISPWSGPSHPDELPSAVLKTSHTLVHNRDLLNSLPAYTCLETIAREQKDAKQKKPRALDIVQVDVGVGRHAEIYSWPGEKAFSSIDLGNLIGYGFAGTGLFHTFASNIFVDHGAIVRLADEQVFQGRAAIHFTYTFPSLASNETLSTHNKTVLIPGSAEIVAIEMNGAIYRDLVTFSQCHVFEAESTIQNSPEALVSAVERYEALRHAIPAGVEIPITLESEIRGDTATIGKQITARLNRAVKISPDLTVPRGAIVNGRIREFREIQDPPNTRQVGLEFNEIDWLRHVAIFFAEAVKLQQVAGLSTLISRGTIEMSNAPAELLTRSTTEKIRPREIPGVTTFFLTSSHVIPKGFQMILRTRKTKHL